MHAISILVEATYPRPPWLSGRHHPRRLQLLGNGSCARQAVRVVGWSQSQSLRLPVRRVAVGESVILKVLIFI